MLILINFILVVLFWLMVDHAAEDDRMGWAYTYLFLSAANGAAILAALF